MKTAGTGKNRTYTGTMAKSGAGRRKRMPITVFLSLLLATVVFPASLYCATSEDFPNRQTDWKLVREDNGIRVYSGKSSGRALVFKADAVIDSAPNALLALMVDINQYIRWLGPCKTARELVRFDETDRIGHALLYAGTFFRDRDIVVHAWAEPDAASGKITVRYESLPEYVPELPGTIRITENRGSWILMPQSENRTRMIWTGRLHPGGWFPTWLLKMLFSTVILSTVEDIQAAASEHFSRKVERPQSAHKGEMKPAL